jgi:integrase
MFSVTFSLKNPKSRKETLIYMFVFYNKERIKISTRQRILPSLWDQKKRAITKNKRILNLKRQEYTGIDERLQIIRDKLNDLKMEVDRYSLEQTVNQKPFTLTGLRNYLLRILDVSNWQLSDNRVLDFLSTCIKQMESGYRKQPNVKRYSVGTIKNYKNLYQAIQRYENHIQKSIHWDTIDRHFYNSFIAWHEDQSYSRNYTGKHIKDFKSILKMAYEEGIHNNSEFKRRYFISPKDSVKKIPLTLQEVQCMFSLDLVDNQMLSFARDIFLLGCYLGLRVSDIKRLSPSHIHDDSSGRYIRIETQKTGAVVQIPISSKARIILEKYNYEIPPFWEQVVNRNLKKIALRMNLPKSRAFKLTLHVSRHTFAKLSYEFGIPSLYIMKITSHSTERNFLRYINIAPEQAVDEFRKHEFFQ